jgi:uncharacterized protein YutE (UPF0331/DUF86 family)
MSESAQREWRLCIDDMIGFAGKVIATRNRLIHGYLGIDNDTLWSIIRGDVPALLERLRALRAAGA